MKIKYKTTILILLIFVINMLLLLGFYEFLIKPSMTETIQTALQNGVIDKIDSYVSSKAEANALVTEIEDGLNRHDFRNSISSVVIKKIFIFELIVFFVLLVILSILLYSRYLKPLEELIQDMDEFRRGIIPQKIVKRKDELGRLQNQFIELTQSVEAERHKQNLIISSISHDIKTPLTVIMGYAERIMKKDFSKEQEKRYLQTIYKKSQNLNEIVNEFDEYLSYNLENALSIHEYNVSYLCDLIKSEYADELSEIGVDFSVTNHCSSMKLSLDLLKFKRLIGNLVDNSVKHMKHNPRITLTISSDKEGVCFSFVDNGCGVLESDLPYIFDPFYTSDQSRKVAGLGLSICKSIVTAHNGTITATNEINGGLRIEVLLPFLNS